MNCLICQARMCTQTTRIPNTPVHGGRGLCRPCYHEQSRAGTLDDWPPVRRGLLAALVDDVEWLAQTGESPELWPKRLGKAAGTIARQLYRAGRPDLARPMSRIEKRERAA